MDTLKYNGLDFLTKGLIYDDSNLHEYVLTDLIL